MEIPLVVICGFLEVGGFVVGVWDWGWLEVCE